MAVKISRILHAGYVLECEGTEIAFDTIFENPFSVNCHAFPSVKFDLAQIRQLKFSAVFISHFHDDHCSLVSLNELDRATPIYLFCVHEELFGWIRKLGFTEVHALEVNQPVHIGAFEIIPRRALDADVDSLFQIKVAGLNILNVVDSWIDENTLELLVRQKPWDLIMWPFQTMRELEVISPLRAEKASDHLPAEWVEQLQALQPKYLVPSSCQFIHETWSWYRHAFFPVTYQQFQNEMSKALPQTQVTRLNPSVAILLTSQGLQKADPLPWMVHSGEQEVDYEYLPDLQPPGTSEVAKNFPALTREQTEYVMDYCRWGLLQKFSSFEPLVDSYFSKARHWRLSLYDHQGVAENFYYRLQGQSISVVSPNEKLVSWVTEVPMAKVFGALTAGETLSSMYIRINDRQFAPDIEEEIQNADILEDPLIRCLFNGVFGAYQLEQLKRLLPS